MQSLFKRHLDERTSCCGYLLPGCRSPSSRLEAWLCASSSPLSIAVEPGSQTHQEGEGLEKYLLRKKIVAEVRRGMSLPLLVCTNELRSCLAHDVRWSMVLLGIRLATRCPSPCIGYLMGASHKVPQCQLLSASRSGPCRSRRSRCPGCSA